MNAATRLAERLRSMLLTLDEQEKALVRNDMAAVHETVAKASSLADEVDELVRDLGVQNAELAPEVREELRGLIERLEDARQRNGLLLAQGLAYTRFSLNVLTGSPDMGYDNSGRGQLQTERLLPARLNVEG